MTTTRRAVQVVMALLLSTASRVGAQPAEGELQPPPPPEVASEPPPPPAPELADAPAVLEVHVGTYERPSEAAPFEEEPAPTRLEAQAQRRPVEKRLLHGFRLGFSYIANTSRPDADNPDQTVLEGYGMQSPSMFLMGYEMFYRLVGHSWLNVLLVWNAMVAGIEQSKFFPIGNFLLGFEIEEDIQMGVGVNLTPDREKPSHMIAAIGWTPLVGSFFVPVHFFFVPDVDGNHRMGTTIGVTW